MSVADEIVEEVEGGEDPILSQIKYRIVRPTDLSRCYDIEKDSYPEDEAASKASLQYRQHHAAPYFRCAVLGDEEDDEVVIGYVCATRCHEFKSEAMTVHEPSGALLAIHSVVVEEQYRSRGIATAMMKDYVRAMEEMTDDGVEKLVLLSKSHNLAFYVRCGFAVMRQSEIDHGSEVWFDCERVVSDAKSSQQGRPCWTVDAFAEERGTGNPSAVVLLEESPVLKDEDIHWMSTVAREFNFSETAFVWPLKHEEGENGDGIEAQQRRYGIRYFTSSGIEIDLCGHATLASGAILFQTLPFKMKGDASIVFSAKKDVLTLTPDLKTWNRNGRSMKIVMEFPQKRISDITSPSDRSAILGMLKAAFHMDNTAENILYMGIDQDGADVLVELTAECFQNLCYDSITFSALSTWEGYSRGLILCCRNPTKILEPNPASCGSEDGSVATVEGPEEPDFLSRFFAPKAGINEDPVTGSAHCRLGPYFGAKLNKKALVGRQTSTRGGTVECVLLEDDRMQIIGSALTTVSGSLYL